MCIHSACELRLDHTTLRGEYCRRATKTTIRLVVITEVREGEVLRASDLSVTIRQGNESRRPLRQLPEGGRHRRSPLGSEDPMFSASWTGAFFDPRYFLGTSPMISEAPWTKALAWGWFSRPGLRHLRRVKFVDGNEAKSCKILSQEWAR